MMLFHPGIMFHLVYLSILIKLLIKQYLGILLNHSPILVIGILQEHIPIHLSPGQVKRSGLFPQHLISMLRQTKLLLELHKVMNGCPLLQSQAQELMNQPNPILFRLQRPQIKPMPIRIGRHQGKRVQQIKLPIIVQFQIQILPILHRKPKLPLSRILVNNELPLKSTHGEKRVPLHQLQHPLAVAINRYFEKVRVFGDPVAEIIGDAKEGSAVVDFAQGNAVARGHHKEFANLLDAVQFHCVHEGVLLSEKVLHEISEAKP
ncbi:hypothetical protein VIGAN_02119300 [Vigna angularis var. angularis]|uniref:Uncharacterized protein n=1 Tax=Vigna angularis var. angularis TaxID=157739 RepID=A0A0S3RD52_PHAAN|nr:hypothetical protein VIGAN_02119300 [Vigna angularis var. angularis]